MSYFWCEVAMTKISFSCASSFKIADSFISFIFLWNWPDKQRILNSKSRKKFTFRLIMQNVLHSARDQLKSISNLNLLEKFLQRSTKNEETQRNQRNLIYYIMVFVFWRFEFLKTGFQLRSNYPLVTNELIRLATDCAYYLLIFSFRKNYVTIYLSTFVVLNRFFFPLSFYLWKRILAYIYIYYISITYILLLLHTYVCTRYNKAKPHFSGYSPHGKRP